MRALFGMGADENTWSGLEDLLIRADVGATAAADVVARVRSDYRNGSDAAELVRDEILAVLGDDEPLQLTPGALSVVLVVGVNGSGKTTTIGKLAKRLTDAGNKVSLAASDTFRAAAGEQLEVWAAGRVHRSSPRSGAPTRGRSPSTPSGPRPPKGAMS